MPARVVAPVQQLSTAVAQIFDQVQLTTANHQKNLIALYKLHLDAAKRTEKDPKRTEDKLVGEAEFQQVFQEMVLRIIGVKKGVATADRVAKFIGAYVPFVNQRAAEDKAEADLDEDDEENTDTTASRFTAKLIRLLLKGFQAKDKNVRYRIASLFSEMLGNLGEMDVEIYDELRTALVDRIHDRESIVRAPVVIALSILSSDEEEQTVLDLLLETLSSDPSAEVRRVALCNIPLDQNTLPLLLARSRDTDTNVRKVLFNLVLTKAATAAGNPRMLTIAQRELVVRNGLGDREPAVREAAASLLETWVDVIAETVVKAEEELASRLAGVDLSNPEKPNRPDGSEKIVKTLTAFLHMFDLTVVSKDNRGELLSGKIPSDALRSVFNTRPDILEELRFGETYFNDLTPEKAFLARVFVEYCDEDKRGDVWMDTAGIPVITSCAFKIQFGYNALVAPDTTAGKSEEELEDARAALETVVGEMLRLGARLDYSDYVGAMKMSDLTRKMLSRPELPMNLIAACLDILRRAHKDERDLIRLVVWIVQELRDSNDEEDDVAANQSQESIVIPDDDDANTSFGSVTKKVPKSRELMSPEEQQRANAIDLRCLSLINELLKRVDDTLDKNSTLLGIKADLIIPSIRSKDKELVQKGLVTWGLYCLISETEASSWLPHFMAEAEKTESEDLKLSIFRIIFDLCMTHKSILANTERDDRIRTYLITQLENESDKPNTSPRILAILTKGIAKLVMTCWSAEEMAVKRLLMVYFSPYNAENQELKQSVAYFAPAFSHSSAANQLVMRNIFTPVFRKLSKLRQELDDEDYVLDLSQVTEMWRYWTDPFQLRDKNGRVDDTVNAENPIQFDMAGDIIRTMMKEEYPKEDKKFLCQMLGKLHIPDKVDIDKIRTLKLLLHTLSSRRPLRDATSKNAFKKFDDAISKKFESELQDFNEEEYRKLEQLKGVFEEVDEIIPEDDDEVISTEPKKKGRKRRSDSIMSTATESDGASVASSKRRRSKPKNKKRRLSTSDDEESDFDDDIHTPRGTPPAPTRTMPRRAATVQPTPIVISSDEDEDEQEATPAAQKRRPRIPVKSRRREEAIIDADIDDLLDGATEIAHDSIMDDSDEEDEVNDLLVED
ncbi:nuclear condensing complex subunit [Roridomyces roridus]|uniref:Nuclear condensing complex subunit n=1 Tax=Roridomyces roridus TaxID=1738132 RepID=A0AAD7CJR2_9AGAR|nr:nuclear condensing complex subunit [Roridomyces roridus]